MKTTVIQQRLKTWGFAPGPIDGVLGPKTKAALLDFQKSKGLQPDGVVGLKTSMLLNAQPCWASFLKRRQCQGGSHMVEEIQTNLKAWGFYSGAIDGIFGKETEAAVLKFQQSKGLSQDGEVGPNTLAALQKTRCWASPWQRPECRGGSHMIEEIQTNLRALGFYVGKIDGIFGSQTQAAVMNFQKNQGLSIDGIVGPTTFAVLNAMPWQNIA